MSWNKTWQVLLLKVDAKSEVWMSTETLSINYGGRVGGGKRKSGRGVLIARCRIITLIPVGAACNYSGRQFA